MTDSKNPLSIAVIGTGKIGKAIAQLLLGAGHSVFFGSRDPKNSLVVEEMGNRAIIQSIEEAIDRCEIIVLAVPYHSLDSLLPLLRPRVTGKIVVDATNPFAFSPEKRIVSSLGANQVAGSRMASLLPEGKVVRAFNHITHELLLSRGMTQPGIWAMAIAGDDSEAKKTVGELVRDAGFSPVDLGALRDSLHLDPGGKLFPHLFTEADMRTTLLAANSSVRTDGVSL